MIVHIITSLTRGGAQKTLCELATRLSDLGYHQAIINLTGINHYNELNNINNLTLIHLDLKKNPFSLFFKINQAIKILHFNSYSNVSLICWMYDSCIFGFFLRNHVDKLIFNIRHTFGSIKKESLKTILFARVVAFLSKFASSSIFCSNASLMQHVKIGYKNAIFIPNFIGRPNSSSNAHTKSDDETIYIGNISRYAPMKRQEKLINDFLLIDNEKYKLILVGCEVNALKNKFTNNELRHIQFIDECTDISSYYSKFDIFVLYSGWGESFPNVLVESVVSHVITYSTAVGAAPEILGLSYCVAPSNNVNELRLFLNHYESIKNLDDSRNSQLKHLYDNFDNDLTLDKYHRILS